MKVRPTLALALVALVEACATAAPAPAARRTRRRPARTAASTPAPQPAAPRAVTVTAPARTAPAPSAAPSFGTAVVSSGNDVGGMRAIWDTSQGRARVRCEGAAPSVVPSTQSPQEPGSAAIVRSFLPAEPAVLRCRPPANERGRLAVQGVFTSNGAPEQYSFPGVELSREAAMCLGAALCGVRVPAFRAASSTLRYEYLVYVTQE